MGLYQKYRPKSFDEIFGNTSMVEMLKKEVAKKEPSHAFLFHGPTGCGKTTMGRIVARELGVVGDDFQEIDTADFRGIDTVREIRKQCRFQPMFGARRAWLIDEAHKMTNDAMNALLKALEDAPKHAYYILCTTEPSKLLATIKGRCSQYQVSQLTEVQMHALLRKVVKAENETLQKVVYEQIAQDSVGHPRNALQILEQVLLVPQEERLSVAKLQAAQQSEAIELCRALISRAGWKKVSRILTGLTQEDPEGLRRLVLGYCNSVLLKGVNPMAATVISAFHEPFYDIGFPGVTFACYSVCFPE